VINSVGIVFKGSGFYVTDNKNGKANSALTGNGRSEKQDEKEKTAEKKENVTPPNKKADSVSAGNAT
jgi:predicted nucleic acid-binding Zn ribbon protein